MTSVLLIPDMAINIAHEIQEKALSVEEEVLEMTREVMRVCNGHNNAVISCGLILSLNLLLSRTPEHIKATLLLSYISLLVGFAEDNLDKPEAIDLTGLVPAGSA